MLETAKEFDATITALAEAATSRLHVNTHNYGTLVSAASSAQTKMVVDSGQALVRVTDCPAILFAVPDPAITYAAEASRFSPNFRVRTSRGALTARMIF